ncbi:MAG: hypothetical protein K6A80_07915 [Saccharofermentans sp.]|nr:hypothetical protein [Saccharofermentans sp.]
MFVRKTRLLTVLLAATVLSVAAVIFVACGSSEAEKMIKKEVSVTYGTPLTVDLFLTEGADPALCSFASDVSVINMDDLATYELSLKYDGEKVRSTLNVIDDVPPVAEAVPQIVYANQAPDPNDCIRALCDKSCVTVDFAEDADWTVGEPRTVNVILTDAYGNVTVIEVPVTVIDDHTPPVISGCTDIYVHVGEHPKYRDGVLVEDDYDDEPSLKINKTAVDLNTIGTYPVVYTAEDAAGNVTEVTINLVVVAADVDIEALLAGNTEARSSSSGDYKNYNDCTADDAYEAARKVLSSISGGASNKIQLGMKIFYWVNHHIAFSVGNTSDNWAIAACQAFGRRKASCFGQAAACKALCDVAGIPNRMVYANDGFHTWLLCYLNGGWYHCDATQWSGGRHNFSYMKTDTEIAAAVGHHSFNHNSYPERSTLSVQAWINVANGTVSSGMPTPTPAPPTEDPADSSEAAESAAAESSGATASSEASSSEEPASGSSQAAPSSSADPSPAAPSSEAAPSSGVAPSSEAAPSAEPAPPSPSAPSDEEGD